MEFVWDGVLGATALFNNTIGGVSKILLCGGVGCIWGVLRWGGRGWVGFGVGVGGGLNSGTDFLKRLQTL